MIDIVLKAVLVLVAVIVGTSSVLIYKGKQDNPVEEVAEMVIEKTTGLDIDLTPTSEED